MRNLSSLSSSEGAYERLLGSKALKAVLAACAISAYSNTVNAEITDAPFGTFPYTDHVNVIKTSPTESYVGMAQYNGVSDWDIYVTNCVNDVCTPEELIDDSACDSDKKINTEGDQTSVAFCPPGSECDGYGFAIGAELFQTGKVMKFEWDHISQQATNCHFLPAPLDGSSGNLNVLALNQDGSILILSNNDGIYTSPTSSPYQKVSVQGITATSLGSAALWGDHLSFSAEDGCGSLGEYDICDSTVVQHATATQPMIVANAQSINVVLGEEINNASSQGYPSIDNYGEKMTYTSGGFVKQVDLPGTGGSAGAAGAGGSGGSAGMGGAAGSAGGTGGTAGEAGSAGMGGSAGAEQDGGPDANDDCGSIAAEGACTIECDGMGTVNGIITENNKDCKLIVQDDCTLTLNINSAALDAKYGDQIPADFNKFEYDNNTRTAQVQPGMERDMNDEGGCFAGWHGGGLFAAMVGTHPVAYYEDGLNGLLTIEEKSGQVNFYTDATKATKVVLTTADGSYLDDNRTCKNDAVCANNELGAGQKAYVDEEDPITEQEIPDAGGDVIDPFADAGVDSGTDTPPVNKAAESGDSGGCAVCTATPGNTPSTPSGVALVIAAAAAAIVARKRKGFVGLESKD